MTAMATGPQALGDGRHVTESRTAAGNPQGTVPTSNGLQQAQYGSLHDPAVSVQVEGSGQPVRAEASYGTMQHAVALLPGTSQAVHGTSTSEPLGAAAPRAVLERPQEEQPHSFSTPPGAVMQLRNVSHYTTEDLHPSPGSNQPPMIRWVTRLTEFLRTTAARGADGVDRVIGEMGFSTPVVVSRRATPSPSAMTRVRQQVLLEASNAQGTFELSPPEELGNGFQIPGSWSQTASTARPLFAPEDVDRLRQVQERSAALMGPALRDQMEPSNAQEDPSSGSSRDRAEIQRQLDGYSARQREEMKRLQQEIFNLKAEKLALEEGRRLGKELAQGQSEGVNQLGVEITGAAGQHGVPGPLLRSDPTGHCQNQAGLLRSAEQLRGHGPALQDRDGLRGGDGQPPRHEPALPDVAGLPGRAELLPGHGTALSHLAELLGAAGQLPGHGPALSDGSGLPGRAGQLPGHGPAPSDFAGRSGRQLQGHGRETSRTTWRGVG